LKWACLHRFIVHRGGELSLPVCNSNQKMPMRCVSRQFNGSFAMLQEWCLGAGYRQTAKPCAPLWNSASVVTTSQISKHRGKYCKLCNSRACVIRRLHTLQISVVHLYRIILSQEIKNCNVENGKKEWIIFSIVFNRKIQFLIVHNTFDEIASSKEFINQIK